MSEKPNRAAGKLGSGPPVFRVFNKACRYFVGLLGRVIGPSQEVYVCGIETHDLYFRALRFVP